MHQLKKIGAIVFSIIALYFCLKAGVDWLFFISESASRQLDNNPEEGASYWQFLPLFSALLIITGCIFRFFLNKKAIQLWPVIIGLGIAVLDNYYNWLLGKYFFSVFYVLILVYFIFLGITKRSVTSIINLLLVVIFLSAISIVKEIFFGTPLGFADVIVFFQSIESNLVLFSIYPQITISIVIFIFVSILLTWLLYRIEKPFIKGRQGVTIFVQLIIVVAAIILLVGYEPLTNFTGNKFDKNNHIDVKYFLDEIFANSPLSRYDPVYRVFAFINYKPLIVDFPKKVAANQYSLLDGPVTPYVPTDIKPDILMIQAESTFDPSLVGACIDKECNRYAYIPPKTNIRSEQGPLQVHINGGGTWLSEFAFLTGLDHRFFKESGSLAPITLAPKMKKTLATHLKNLGYRTVAIYPVDGDFMRARAAYRFYGFDEFYSLPEIYASRGVNEFNGTNNTEKLRNWAKVHDGEIYTEAIQNLVKLKEDNRPIFVYILTIRNHSPWGGEMVLDLNCLKISSICPALSDYADKLKETDVAFLNVLDTWLSSKRPRVIGWYGDHQPATNFEYGLFNKDISRQIPNNYKKFFKFFTYYGLFSNYQDGGVPDSSQAIDIAFLSTKLLKFSSLPLPEDLKYSDVINQECSGGLFNCEKKDFVNAYISKRIYQDHILNSD